MDVASHILFLRDSIYIFGLAKKPSWLEKLQLNKVVFPEIDLSVFTDCVINLFFNNINIEAMTTMSKKLMHLFQDSSLSNGFTNINDVAKKHELSTRIFKVLRIKGAIVKENGVNKFSPYFNYSEDFAKQIAKDSNDYKKFQERRDAIKKQFVDALKNQDAYPHDLDDWWQILGYAQKRNAERALKGLNLPESEVFFAINGKNSREFNPETGRLRDRVRLSNRAFSHLCMAAQTFMGSVIRDYFYEVREELELLKKELEEGAHQYSETYRDFLDFRFDFETFFRGLKKKGNQLDHMQEYLSGGILKLRHGNDGQLALFEHNAQYLIDRATYMNELKEGVEEFSIKLDKYINKYKD